MVRDGFRRLVLPPKIRQNIINSTYPGFNNNVVKRDKKDVISCYSGTYQTGLLQDQICDSEAFPSVLGGGECFVKLVGRRRSP